MVIRTFREVIDRWASPDALAERIGSKAETVRKWRQRNSIPAEWWSRIIEAERSRSDGVTAEDLADMAARSDSDSAPREFQDTGT